MTSYKTSRVITVVFSLLLIAVAIAAVISFARVFVFPSGSNKTSDADKSALLNTSADRAVIMKVRGAIVADENFRSYQIKISPNYRTLTTYKGYKEDVLNEKKLNNNIPSYEQFVYALYHANMIRGTELTGDANNTKGVCSDGELYEFKVLKDNESVKTLWTTSCSRIKGSLGVSKSALEDLFIGQIPDADDDYINDLW